MSIPKELANKVLTNLDTAASRIEKLAKAGKIDTRLASNLVRDIDAFADRFEVSAYGKDSLKRRQAKVLQHDSDEKYMGTFNEPNKRHKGDSDESWMDKNSPGARWDSMVDNFDQDRTNAVADRVEYQPVGLNEYADAPKKQPSMKDGFKKHKASTKTWAD
jgi:hypothetical protein